MSAGRALAVRSVRWWRRLPDLRESELLPQGRLTGPMPWVVAIMVALTAIAAAAGLALRNTAQATLDELAGGVTVQIVEASPEKRQSQAQAALARLRDMPDVVSYRLVPASEVDELIEPWLGAGDGADMAIPVPALIDVRIRGEVSADRLAAIRTELRGVAPASRVDAQSSWLAPVFDAISSLQWLAVALVGLLAATLAAAVLLAARSALGANRDTIEIVHLLGGSDAQIARVFQRSIGIDAAAGGALGLAAAVVVILILGQRFAGLGAGMVDNGALDAGDWLLLALIPVLAALLAMATARLTVLHTLRKML